MVTLVYRIVIKHFTSRLRLTNRKSTKAIKKDKATNERYGNKMWKIDYAILMIIIRDRFINHIYTIVLILNDIMVKKYGLLSDSIQKLINIFNYYYNTTQP